MSDDLAEFLIARIAEDEQVAREAVAQNDTYFEIKGWAWWDEDFGGFHLFDPHLHEGVEVGKPARVLAECDAKRDVIRLLRRYEGAIRQESNIAKPGDPLPTNLYAARNAVEQVVRLLALPYADHPDYRQEWTP